MRLRPLVTSLALSSLLALPVLATQAGCDGDAGTSTTDTAGTDTAGTDTAGTDTAVEDTVAADAAADLGPSADAVEDTAVEDTAADAVEDAVDDTALPSFCANPGTVDCEDEIVLDLSLHKDMISTGAVTNEQDGADWVSHVDATAGGYGSSSQNPWVYARFTDSGLEKVAIDDWTALESTDWDIAFKRFGIRLNSGVSGPGCVVGAAIVGGSYDGVTEFNPSTALHEEAFYDTQSCTIIPDSSGLGSPNYLMSGWWSYDSCVQTTGTPFLILTDTTALKLVVEAYYKSNQEACNAGQGPGSESANLTIRWQALP